MNTELHLLAESIQELVRAIALDRAYQLAERACDECGLPACRGYRKSMPAHFSMVIPEYGMLCDRCPCPEDLTDDLPARKAIERLVRIARGE